MAYAVLQAVGIRLQREGRLHGPLPETLLIPGLDGPDLRPSAVIERPPLSQLRAAA
jgi:hypothetical protein